MVSEDGSTLIGEGIEKQKQQNGTLLTFRYIIAHLPEETAWVHAYFKVCAQTLEASGLPAGEYIDLCSGISNCENIRYLSNLAGVEYALPKGSSRLAHHDIFWSLLYIHFSLRLSLKESLNHVAMTSARMKRLVSFKLSYLALTTWNAYCACSHCSRAALSLSCKRALSLSST